MTTYTTPHSLPLLESTDKIAAPGDGLRQDINALAHAANTALVAMESKNATQDIAIADARSGAIADAKAYADAQIAQDRTRLSAVESKNAGQDVRLASVESAAFVGGGLLMEDPADPGFYLVGAP